jgi:hypothetical protein
MHAYNDLSAFLFPGHLSVAIYLLISSIAKNYSEEKRFPIHSTLNYYFKKVVFMDK